MNLYFCPKCSTEVFGPEWRLNQAAVAITDNPEHDFPDCKDCNCSMQPTTGMEEEDIELT